jgi:hypothetical protein
MSNRTPITKATLPESTPDIEAEVVDTTQEEMVEVDVGITGVALLDVLSEEELTELTRVAARSIRMFYALLSSPNVVEGEDKKVVESKVSDELANNLVYDYHRRLWGAREESNS